MNETETKAKLKEL